MNEMENLYEEYKKLRDELSEKNIDEMGVFELRSYRRRFENIHRSNLELQDSLRFSREVDVEELRQSLNLGDRLWFELGETLKPVIEVIDIKMALGKQLADESTHIRELKRENLKNIKTLVNQNKRFKKKIDEITDPELKTIFEEKLKSDEDTIQKLKDLDASYNKRLENLSEKLRKVVKGGVLSEFEEIRKDTEGLDEENAKRLANEMEEKANEKVENADDLDREEVDDLNNEMQNAAKSTESSQGIPGVEFEGVDPVTPINENDDLTRGLGGEPEEAPVPVLGDEQEEAPTPIIDQDEQETPVPILEREQEEQPIPPLDEKEQEEQPIPPLNVNPENNETPENGEEITPVNGVEQPKSILWQKVQKVLEGAKLFLLTAIGIHTGLIAGGINNEKVEENTNTEIVEEVEDESYEDTNQNDLNSDENVVGDSKPSTSTPENSTPIVDNTNSSQQVATQNPIVNPGQPEEQKKPEVVTPEHNVTVSADDVILNPGESVYDSQTGVEVAYTGAAVQETNTGYVPQEDRQLNNITPTSVVVTNEDLQPDPVQTELPRTGQEVSEEVARQSMTQGEQDNLDLAAADIDFDLEAFFNDGPIL